jgi:SAM-dependent methyltransferase
MNEGDLVGRKAREFFDDLWGKGDPWELESSAFEQDRYAHLLAAIAGRRYGRALEVGCGAGAFTRLLSEVVDEVVALDVSSTAIARAKAAGAGPGSIDYRIANIMEFDPRAEGPWDLVVMSETIYYLGWLYPFFDVGWLASQLFTATRDGGWLLLANTKGGTEDWLLLPWLIRTYHDLFLNVGFRLETEEIFRGRKKGVDLEVLISLLTKP